MSRTITIRHQIGFHTVFPSLDLVKRPSAIGTIQPGTIVPITKEEIGYEYEKELSFIDENGLISKQNIQSNIWYQDLNGWWHWEGATKTWEEIKEGFPSPIIPPLPAPVIFPDQTFNWKNKIKSSGSIPTTWLKHKGKGVNVAVIDAGFNLNDSCFSHLQSQVKTYDLRKNKYNSFQLLNDSNFISLLDGKDAMPKNIHGTSCLSILAAQHPQKELLGIIPNANFHLFNVYEHHKGPFNTIIIKRSIELFKKAILLISKMDIDLVSVSISFPQDEILEDELIQKIISSSALWFWALKSQHHPTLDKYILNPSFPSPFFPIQKIGTMLDQQLSDPNSLVVGESEKDGIDFLIQKNKISILIGDKIDHDRILDCSYATPLLTGIAALLLNEEKKLNPNYHLNPKTFIHKLKKEATRFYQDYNPDIDAFSFLRLEKNPIT